jgi:large subunit ribosomal protein L11
MSKETVDLIVEGGKASAGAQMGQSFGPLGINIQEIVDKINEKTADMKGMKLPVKVKVDTETKEFDLEIGAPPVSELIKKEIGIDKGSGMPHLDKMGNMAIQQIIKVAKMKRDSMLVNSLKAAVKSVVGSCGPLGILIEGKSPLETCKEIDEGKYNNEIDSGLTETSEEKQKELDAQLEEIKIELSKEKAIIDAEEEEEKEKEEKPTEEDTKEEKDETPTEEEK